MSVVAKSCNKKGADPVFSYCNKLTVVVHPLQKELQEKTLKDAPAAGMLGAPEVLTIGANFIHLIGGKRVLDIRTFTGASALAWVYTFDISHKNYNTFRVPVISKDQEIFSRIVPIENPALESLDNLIADGESGTFDFGGVIMIDTALWGGRVAQDPSTFETSTKKIFHDDRTYSSLINCGDGIHIAFKK
ncbi:unnamed protein product [Heligmosomoides polygyrus]|uniref:DUF3846 domain-containing protein n=1 Tax=Heligmosomoides polygyrus TaxID=6339 RepID=A0A183FT69_HELPZ|nr:unnamed protein product [Heligmosomoides polygyrus]